MKSLSCVPLLAAALCAFAISPAVADCINPKTIARATTPISRTFTDNNEATLLAGTGWFLSPRKIATAAHVARGLQLSTDSWARIDLGQQGLADRVDARIGQLVDANPEKIAVIELRKPVRGAIPLSVRSAPLKPDEPILSVAYSGMRLRFAGGRFVDSPSSTRFPGAALFEIYDGTDRLVIDEGASGAPVLDCRGEVVGVITGTLSQEVTIFARTMRISTAWQKPNVVGIPVGRLANLGW